MYCCVLINTPAPSYTISFRTWIVKITGTYNMHIYVWELSGSPLFQWVPRVKSFLHLHFQVVIAVQYVCFAMTVARYKERFLKGLGCKLSLNYRCLLHFYTSVMHLLMCCGTWLSFMTAAKLLKFYVRTARLCISCLQILNLLLFWLSLSDLLWKQFLYPFING